ncbi:RICIN domain-containing protein, partial [Bacillus thuringiensis]|nr:RICIN domain-containing protein [Bacillus thuringiensis]
ALIREQYNNINSYTDTVPNASVLINGDLTAFGHGWQWDKINELLRILKRPYYYGLGNHDIENNFNDCVNNGCFKNSMENLIAHVQTRGIPSTQFDYRTQPGEPYLGIPVTKHQGSFAYAVNFGSICSIQLQNFPTMNKQTGPTITDFNEYHIFENFDWVRTQLETARINGKTIIINVHKHQMLYDQYKNLFQQYGVAAIFAGHLHTNFGYQISYNNIPIFLSGGASQRTYLIIEQFSNRLDMYAVNCNDWRNRCLMSPIFNGEYQIVTALNNSSVVSLEGASNTNVILMSNNKADTQKWYLSYNSVKNGYVIRRNRASNIVLAWNAAGGTANVFTTQLIETYDAHYWAIERVNNSNEYIFKNKMNPDLVLEVAGSQTTNGTNIQVHARHPLNTSLRNQTFLIQPI